MLRRRSAPLAGSPFGWLDAGRLHPIRQLATDRHLDPEQVEAGRREGGRLVERLVDLRLGKRGADPRPRRLAEEVEELAPGGPIGVDAVDRDVDQPARLGHRDLAAVGLTQELRLEREVDGAGRHIERELLRFEVVLGQRHRERQRDPTAEAVMSAGQPAIDGGAGERSTRAVETGHAEEPQQRALLTERGRCACPRAPRASQGLGALGELVDRAVSH